MKRALALIAVAAIALATGASAEQQEKTAKTRPGEQKRVAVYSMRYGACTGARKPVIAFIKRPRHGTVGTAPAIEKVKFPGNVCDGKEVPGVGIFYTPEPGFTGTDSFTFLRRNPDTGSTSGRVRMTVTVE